MCHRNRLLALSGLVVGLLLAAGAAHSADPPDSVGSGKWRALYADVLERHTRAVPQTVGTVVDYRALRSDPRWRELVRTLSSVDPASLRTREEKLAFWIDVYNIFAIDLVVTNEPEASIKDIGSFLWPVWKRDAGSLAGRVYSLGEIEHQILRPLGDPRIHAAIVCASTSCPSLRRKPFLPAAIDAQLDEVFRRFVADTRKGARVDADTRTLWLSSIFDWFGEDFALRGGVRAYVLRHLPAARAAELRALGDGVEIEYLDYDWSLNRAGGEVR